MFSVSRRVCFKDLSNTVCNICYCAKATAFPQILSWLLMLLAVHNMYKKSNRASHIKISYMLIDISEFHKYWLKQV